MNTHLIVFSPFVCISLQLHSNSDKGDGSVRYILDGEGAGSIFIIDEVTGDIHATKSLDREKKSHYVLHAQALDRYTEEALEPKSEFIIKVQDINDNAPKFPDGPFVATVPEMSEVGESRFEAKTICFTTGSSAFSENSSARCLIDDPVFTSPYIPVIKRRKSFPAAPDMSSMFQSDSHKCCSEEEHLKNRHVTMFLRMFDLPSPRFHVCFPAAGTFPGGQVFIKHSMAAPQTSATTETVEPFTLQKTEREKKQKQASALLLWDSCSAAHCFGAWANPEKAEAFFQSAAVWLTVRELKMVL